MISPRLGLSVLALALILSPTAQAGSTFTITGNTADQELFYNGASGYGGSNVTGTSIFVGSSHLTNSNNPHVGIFVFQLPTLAAGTQFATTNLNLTVGGLSAPSFSANLSGITQISTSSTVLKGTTNDATDPATLLDPNYVTSSATVNSTVVSTNLAGFLNTQYANGANAGQYIFFRVDGGSGGSTSSDNGYTFVSADSSSKPTLTYTTTSTGQGAAPEASGVALLLIPGGLLAGALLRRRFYGSPRVDG